MEAYYYMIIDGRQAGPFVLGELKYHNIRPDSMVWRQGLENWVQASSLPELSGILYGSPDTYGSPKPDMLQPGCEPVNPAPAAPQESGPVYPSPLRGAYYEDGPIEHTNWLPWAIVCTVLGAVTSCITLILGIIGIVQSNKANAFYNSGNRGEGDRANSTAKTVVIIGLILGVLGIIAMIFLFSAGLYESIVQESVRQAMENLE